MELVQKFRIVVILGGSVYLFCVPHYVHNLDTCRYPFKNRYVLGTWVTVLSLTIKQAVKTLHNGLQLTTQNDISIKSHHYTERSHSYLKVNS